MFRPPVSQSGRSLGWVKSLGSVRARRGSGCAAPILLRVKLRNRLELRERLPITPEHPLPRHEHADDTRAATNENAGEVLRSASRREALVAPWGTFANASRRGHVWAPERSNEVPATSASVATLPPGRLVNTLKVVDEPVLCRGGPFITFDDDRRRIERQLECDPAAFTRDRGAFRFRSLTICRWLAAPVV